MNPTRSFRDVAIFIVAVTLPLSAAAQLRVDPDAIDNDRWHYRITPYAWGAGLDGTVGKFDRRAEIDKSFSDILHDLDFGAMVGFEARRGRVGLLAELMYVRVSESDRVPTPFGFSVKVNVTARTTTGLLAATYRVAVDDWGYVDVLGGARHWSLRTDVRLGGPLNLRGRNTESWTNPVIGVRGLHHLGPRTYALGWAMAGGFGVGSRSSSDLMAGLGYQLNEQAALLFAYRRLAVDYRNSGFVFDTTLQGPVIGLDYRF
ncbi:hypothetical protein ACKVEX_10050 [Rhodocyclaceae bacterium SMB388]